MKTRNELMAELQSGAIREVALNHQEEGIKKLFQSASMLGDNELADKYREQLHGIMDARLDIMATAMSISKTLATTLE